MARLVLDAIFRWATLPSFFCEIMKSQIIDSTKTIKRKIIDAATGSVSLTGKAANAILATNLSVNLDRLMRASFSGPATDYDKALDYAYNTLKQHGRDHRLFDGSHDLVGAWKAITEHVPEEAWLKKAEGYVMALWKDVATPNGLPVATWNKEAFDKTAGFLEQTLGISRSWTKDMVSFTGTELMGATIGAIAIAFAWKKADIRKFSEIVASLGLSAVVGANPVMTIITIIALARCFQEARMDQKKLKPILVRGSKGLLTTGTFMLTMSVVSGPVWMSIMLAIVSYAIVQYLFKKADLEAVELDQVLDNWFQGTTATLSNIKDKASNVPESKLAQAAQQKATSWASATASTIAGIWSTTILNMMSLVPQGEGDLGFKPNLSHN